MNRILFLLILTASIALGVRASAQTAGPEFAPAPAADNGERFKRNLERWKQMTPEQQEKIRQRFQQWKNLTDEQRQKIRANMERWKKMQTDKQQGILRAHQWMGHLQEPSREQLERRMHEIESLPPERRRLVMQKIVTIQAILHDDMEKLRALPPDSPEARQFVQQMRMKGMILHRMPPEEIERLKNLTPEERQEAIKNLWSEHKQMMGPMPEGGPRPFDWRGGPGPHGEGQHHRLGPPHPPPQTTPEVPPT